MNNLFYTLISPNYAGIADLYLSVTCEKYSSLIKDLKMCPDMKKPYPWNPLLNFNPYLTGGGGGLLQPL